MRETRHTHQGLEVTVLVCPVEGHIEFFGDDFCFVTASFAEGLMICAELYQNTRDRPAVAKIAAASTLALLEAQRDLAEHFECLRAEIEFLEEEMAEAPDDWSRHLDAANDDLYFYARFVPKKVEARFSLTPSLVPNAEDPDDDVEDDDVFAFIHSTVTVDLTGNMV